MRANAVVLCLAGAAALTVGTLAGMFEAASAGPPEVRVELVPPAPPETSVGRLPAGTYFLDPLGDLRQVVAPLLPPGGDAPAHAWWGIRDQPPRTEGRVYAVLVSDGTLTLMPADVRARPVIGAAVIVRAGE